MLDRRIALAAHPAERADLGTRAGRLVEVELVDPLAAIGRYEEVLKLLPGHAGARAALEALLSSEDHALAAAAVLEPVYRQALDHAALVTLFERRLVVNSADDSAQLADFSALAEITRRWRDSRRSPSTPGRGPWPRTPDELSLLEPLLRLASATGRWADLAALLKAHLGRALDPEVHHQVAMQLGAIYEEHVGDLAGATSAFERAASGSASGRRWRPSSAC